MQCDETNSHMVRVGQSYADHISILFRVTAGRSYIDLISSTTGQSYADPISILFQVTAGRSYFNLISGYSRLILGRSYADPISILFRVTAGRSYFDLISGYRRPILGRSYADLISVYNRPILLPHSAKRMRDCRQNHHGSRHNKLRLLWNALLTTPYVK